MGPKQSKTSTSVANGKASTPQPSPASNRRAKFKQEAAFDDPIEHQVLSQEQNALPFIGLIRGKFRSNQGPHIGTGVIISEDLVLTVAHNVCEINKDRFRKYKKHLQSSISATLGSTAQTTRALTAEEAEEEFKHVQWAEWLEFYPGTRLQGLAGKEELMRNQNTEGNYCKVLQYKVHPAYITDPNHELYDLCLLRLATPLKLENIKLLENYTNNTTEISVFGYPAREFYQVEEDGIKLLQCGTKGSFQVNEETGRMAYRFTTKPGQSGSPIFINTNRDGKQERFCIGIHRSAYEHEQENVGILLNEDKMQWIASAEEQLTGRLSRVAKAKLPRLPPSNVPNRPQKDVSRKSLQDIEEELKMTAIEQAASTPKRVIYLHREAALLCLASENYARAADYYKSFVELLEALDGSGRNEDDEEEYDAALINWAKCRCELNDLQGSLDLYAKAEQKSREFLRWSPLKESVILNNRAAVLDRMGRHQDALELFEHVLRLRRGKLGEEHLLTYNALENVASLRMKLGLNTQQCLFDYSRVFAFKEGKFGIGSREALRSRTNLAFAQLEANRYQEGLESCRYCLEKARELGSLPSFGVEFTRRMRELSRSDCSLDNLRYGFDLSREYGLEEAARELNEEWAKRNAQQ